MQLRSVAIAICLTISAEQAVWAGTGTSTLTAQTSVASSCTISTAAIAFGNYNPVATNKTGDLNATGSVTITCVKDTAPTITLALGNNASGSTRRLRSGATANFLNYELYQPPDNLAPGGIGTPCSFPGTTVWGTTGGNIFSPTAAPSKSARTYKICGAIPMGQDPAIGASYTDTVVVTVNF
jgi:spore coat protein U-like protein